MTCGWTKNPRRAKSSQDLDGRSSWGEGMKGGVRGKRGAGDGVFGLHSTLLMGISRD